MNATRRDMLRWGGIGGGAALLSGAALAAELPGLLAVGEPLAAVTPEPPVSVAPAIIKPAAPAGIDPALFDRAMTALDTHGAAIRHRDWIGIADFARPSSDPRFHLVELSSRRVGSFFVSHGRGSDQGHTGWLDRFSNAVGSNATSNGAYATSDFYHGKYGLSMKLDGLDPSNDRAFERAIVVHQAWYAEPDLLASHGKLGRSEGCFAFGRDAHFIVMKNLGPGRLIYADKLA